MVDVTLGNSPEWYGGATGIVKNQNERARNLGAEPYRTFLGEKLAPFSNLQNQSFDLAPRYAQPSPYYGQAQGAIQGALGRNVGAEITPYLQSATTVPGAGEIGQFFNPYQQQVVENIGRLGSRNLMENILPGIQNKFISSGQYGSTGHQNLTNRAIRDTQEGISQAQGQALHGGYNTALQSALGQQERQLQAGQLAGTTAGRDAERQILGGEALQNLAGAEQTHGLRGVGVLSQLGGQQQQQQQNAHNIAVQDFMAEKRHPYEQLKYEHELARGLPVTSQIYSQNIQSVQPPQPQASPYTQMGGLLAGIAGAANQRQGYAHGGAVKQLSHHRHYAQGGSLSPIQQGANAAIDTAELKEMRNQAQSLSRPQVDPFWASISRAGFNMAANRQPGVLAKLGEAGNAGLDEYHSQLANQDNRGIQSANIMNMIDTTRRLQAENNRKHQLELEKFGQHQKEFGMTHAINAGTLGLAQQKYKDEKENASSGINPEYEKARAKEEGKLDVKRSEDIREHSAKQYQGIKRIDQILDNLDEAQLGPGFDARKYIASSAQSLGIDIPSLGNPTSMLEVKKGLIQLATEATKDFAVRPTNFELQTMVESLPQTFDSPEAARQVLQSIRVFKEYGAQQDAFKDKWEKDFGSIRKKAPNGMSFDQSYRQFADSKIWPKLKPLKKKYEVKA